MDDLKMGQILWTAKDVATYLGRSKAAVYMMVYRGQLPYIKMGSGNAAVRFDREKIMKIVENSTVDALKPVV